MSDEDKAQLSFLLSQTCAIQKTYGKKIEELETMVKGFAWMLGDEWTIEQIAYGLKKYVRSKPDIPTVSELLEILYAERAKTPASKYRNLIWRKEKGLSLSNVDEDFIKKYEDDNGIREAG